MHHLMVKDHLDALQFIIDEAKTKTAITVPFIQQIAAIVMKNTGAAYNTALGSFDSSKGDFHLLNVSAGIGGKSYLNYSKVPQAMKELCSDFEKRLVNEILTTEQVNDLAFLLHYQFVTIHPFAYENGRSGRLLMNYIQAYFNKPLTVIFSQNKADYINALVETRKQENIEVFLEFLRTQHLSYLNDEIERLQPQEIIKKNFGGIGLFF